MPRLPVVTVLACALALVSAVANAKPHRQQQQTLGSYQPDNNGRIVFVPGAGADAQALSHESKLVRTARHRAGDGITNPRPSHEETAFLPHPAGCPAIRFCACGAAVRIFGSSIRALWPVSAWRRFPRDQAAAGNVAIARRHSHLFVLESHVGGDDWVVSDFNSGGHRSRRHIRSIAGLVIVNPRGQVTNYSARRHRRVRR